MCKATPVRAGGGLGVAYNHLGAIHGKAPSANADSFFLCGVSLIELPASSDIPFDDFLGAIEPGMKPGPTMFLKQARMIRKLAADYDRVVVLAYTPFYLWPVVRLGFDQKVICLHSEHSKGGRHFELAEEKGGKFGFKEHIVRNGVRTNFLSANRAIFPSAGSAQLFEEMNPDLAAAVDRKVEVVHNGVEVFEPIKRNSHVGEEVRINSIAHHVREKGLGNVMEALAAADLGDTKWRFTNYGSTSGITSELTEQAATLGISDRVEFAGLKPQAEVRDNLSAADVFLHLPVIVVFDLSLLEAMMGATPVITTKLPGNIEALGEDYPLYADSPREAADKLAWVSANREAAAEIGADLRKRALELFTKDAMAKRYHDLMVRSENKGN